MSSVLFIAHPGHELRLHHWLEQERPVVYVLTDGSGGGEVSRAASTERLLAGTGAEVGSLFARYTDRQVYALLREQRLDEVLALAADLQQEWARLGVTSVTADMLEGFNTGHDLVRLLVSAVVLRLRRQPGAVVQSWDFPLEGRPDRLCQEVAMELLAPVVLDAEAWQRKQAAARAYPELQGEVAAAVAAWGPDCFRTEVRRQAPEFPGLDWAEAEPPWYEVYGQKMIAAGRYQTLISYAAHLQPVARELQRWALED